MKTTNTSGGTLPSLFFNSSGTLRTSWNIIFYTNITNTIEPCEIRSHAWCNRQISCFLLDSHNLVISTIKKKKLCCSFSKELKMSLFFFFLIDVLVCMVYLNRSQIFYVRGRRFFKTIIYSLGFRCFRCIKQNKKRDLGQRNPMR